MASGSSSEPKEGTPSFFKVVRYPSARHLCLPIAFVRRYLGIIPKNPILKTETGEHSWRLTVKKIGEDYCFANGWDKLAKDAKLCIADVLVFRLTDPLTFQVSFFDSQGCDKDLSSVNTSGADDEVTPTPDDDLSFQELISEKTHKYIMELPNKFVKAAGLENETKIKIKDLEGKEWVLGLMTEKYYNRTTHSLSAGWPLFRQYHDLSAGYICLFKFLKEEGVLSLAQVIKSKSPRNQETPPQSVKVKIEEESGAEEVVVKRKRGRPRRKKPASSSSSDIVEVNTELVNTELKTDLVKRKRGRPRRQKPEAEAEGVAVAVAETDRLFGNKQVVYF